MRSRPSSSVSEERELFRNGGEMGVLMASIDWSKTAVGPIEGWSQALRTMVGLLLRNKFPMLLWWGPTFVQFYNDAYRAIPGDKHPRSMGQPASECWREIWHIIGPMIEQPFQGRNATTSDDLFILIQRRGFSEETHFKVAYSPVPDETVTTTGVGGVLATVAETTEQVYGERQLRTLRVLAARAADAVTAEDACAIAAGALLENDWDVPFALFYLLDREGKRATLASSVGFDVERAATLPRHVDLSDPDGPWPLKSILSRGSSTVLKELHRRLPWAPAGRWSRPPHTAVALPLAAPEQAHAYGVLICGVSPHRLLDESYLGFYELAAQQVVSAIRNARALQEERLRAEELANLDRTKTAFFSNVSHEFRTPLTLMLGPLEEALRVGTAHGVERERLKTAYRNALRLLKLVNTLLDFSRIEAGRVQASFEATDLAVLTGELASVFRSAVEKAGLKYVVDCPLLKEQVWVDRQMWEKIVLNLISNAFKFTFEGRITVRLRATEGRAELSVCDTGTGIPQAELPRVFERFHRVQNARGRTHEGSGIGLALVQELVRLHGGTVRVESVVDAGSTFTVSVPLGHGHLPPDRLQRASLAASTTGRGEAFVEEAVHWLPSETKPEPSPVAEHPPGRILLADDNRDMREYVARILGNHWTVEAVANGKEALAAAAAAPPDIVLSDVMMPELDGFGLLRALRDNPATRTIPVILLSARAGEESRVEGLEVGADDYLIKPFSARELVARVGSSLRMSRLRKSTEEKIRELNMALERRVAERTTRLSETLRELETFSFTVAHDLRAPLRAMSQFSDILIEDFGPKLGKEGLDHALRIGQAAVRMDRLTMDLLEYSRLARADLVLGPTDVGTTIQEVLSSMEREAAAKGASLRAETASARVVGNPFLLTRALTNLVGNALKFVRPGVPPQVVVRVTPLGDWVRVWVEDNGIGIDRAHHEKLFRVFERLDPEGPIPGTGIGLAIARKAVERMNGLVGLESEPGHGSRFWIELPGAPTR
jgi:signal transduction histidine kinase